MGFLERLGINQGNGQPAPAPGLDPDVAFQIETLQETIAELEMALAAEDVGWARPGSISDAGEFSKDAINRIGKLAVLNWLKNPLIRRGVNVQVYYVFGQGMTIRAVDDEVNDVVQAFMDDSKNRAEFTSHQARELKEIDLRLLGNMFFVFFVDQDTGKVRVRTLPASQIDDIITNPEDAKEPWAYLRSWEQRDLQGKIHKHKRAYPDWRLSSEVNLPNEIRGYPLAEEPVYHVKTGALSHMKFGVSEVYSALDWAKAYKQFLEDWATLTRALSRWAHVMTVPSRKGVQNAKRRMNSTYAESTFGEQNPPPVTGSTFVSTPDINLSPMRIGGANISSDDGRRLLLMVAAALDLPETFFGDSSVGTLATAQSLDRPTELQMRDRQTLWADVHSDIMNFVIIQAVRYGDLRGRIVEETDGTPAVELPIDPETGDPRDTSVSVTFPPILEHDIPDRVDSIVTAGTLKGMNMSEVMPKETISRLLLETLGVEDVDALLDEIYAEQEAADLDDDMSPLVPGDEEGVGGGAAPSVAAFAQALKDVRETLEALRENASA